MHKIIYPGGTENGTGHVEYTWWPDGNLHQVIDKLDSTANPRITTFHEKGFQLKSKIYFR